MRIRQIASVTLIKEVIEIDLSLDTDIPKGTLAFSGARIITMKGEKIIEAGTVVVKENRIIEIGNDDEVEIPDDAIIIDVSGKVIMPGIIDTHAHLNAFRLWFEPPERMAILCQPCLWNNCNS